MLLPAAAAIAASVVALAVTTTLSQLAVRSLRQATEEDFPSLLLYRDVKSQVEAAHTALRLAAVAGEPGQVDGADGFRDEAVRMLQDDGPATIGKQFADKYQADVEAYYALDRAEALAQATRIQGFRVSGAARQADDGAPTAKAEAATDLYNKLLGRIDTEGHAARQLIEERFEGVARQQRTSILVSALTVLAAVLVSGALAWWLSGMTSRPLRALAELTNRIADGDLTPEVPVLPGDEVGALADGFRRMVGRLREIVTTLQTASRDLGVAAGELGVATRAQSSMLERHASGVAETGSTTRQLEQSAGLAAKRAATVLDVARRAAEMSESGHASAERSAEELRRMQEAIETVVGQSSKLADHARQVGLIVGTVRDLAAQSHVLSLNASIEAAGAGEAGQGFSVVAREVRELADQSGLGASRIAKMVQEMLSAVQATLRTTTQGSEAISGSLGQIRASGDSLREIGGIVHETSEAVQQIAVAVREQFAGIGQISVAMRDIDKGMEETVGHIRTLEHSARQVEETASRISGIAEGFRI
jgi:methyl-accepting chemotaxis protein